MKDIWRINNPYQDDKIIDACSIFGVMDTTGKRFSGEGVVKAITNMHIRGNGLGGGFAIYGLYPEYADQYALHIMYRSPMGQQETESYIRSKFNLIHAEEVPTQSISVINDPPIIWRYFLSVDPNQIEDKSEDDFVVDAVMEINLRLHDSFVFSSGKNMAVFKGVGYPEEVAEYFCLEQYKGYLWTAHGRFPTNTPGWWGGAHPFSILDWTVVHNGEISSYGINRRYLEQFGYHCTLQTDTEVIAYAVDLLVRRHHLPMDVVAEILAPPLWDFIERQSAEQQQRIRVLRQIYGSLLLNGPFTIIIAHHNEMIGLTDRIRLRPLTAGTRGSKLYLSSEESAIRLISPNLDKAWIPKGGEPVISRLKAPQKRQLVAI